MLYGASNGVLTIVRGIVPAELFGRTAFGSTLGSLAAPSLVARAVAPLACAGLAVPGAASLGWLVALIVLSVAAVASLRGGGGQALTHRYSGPVTRSNYSE